MITLVQDYHGLQMVIQAALQLHLHMSDPDTFMHVVTQRCRGTEITQLTFHLSMFALKKLSNRFIWMLISDTCFYQKAYWFGSLVMLHPKHWHWLKNEQTQRPQNSPKYTDTLGSISKCLLWLKRVMMKLCKLCIHVLKAHERNFQFEAPLT